MPGLQLIPLFEFLKGHQLQLREPPIQNKAKIDLSQLCHTLQ